MTASIDSSISKLLKELKESVTFTTSEHLFVSKAAKQCNIAPRLLNQHVKRQAKNRWMLISQRLEKKGVSPTHSLYFKSENNLQASAASLILRALIDGEMKKEEVIATKKKLAQITNKSRTVTNLIEKYFAILAEQGELLIENSNRIELKNNMLQLYEKVLAGAVRRKNMTLAENAPNEFKKENINLFDELTRFLTRRHATT